MPSVVSWLVGFSALQSYLEGLIDCIDSRVNLAKKVLGIEVDGGQSDRYEPATSATGQ